MTTSRERAIDSISAAIQDEGLQSSIIAGTNLRPIAERIYSRAGRDVMEAMQSEDKKCGK